MSDENTSGPAWDRRPKGNGKSPAPALIIALVVGFLFGAITILRGAHLGAQTPGGTIAAGVGEGLGAAALVGLLAWLIVYFAAVKPSGRRVGGAYAGIMFGVLLLALIPIGILHQAGGVSLPGAAGSQSRPEQTDVDGEALKYSDRLNADAHAFDAEIMATATTQFLKPQALAAPGGLAKAAAILKQQRAIVTKYQTLYAQRVADERAFAAASYTDPEDKKKAVAGFDSGVAKNAPTLHDYWRLQFDILDREDALVSYLTRNRSGWRAEGDKTMFTRPGLLMQYQIEVGTLQADQGELKDLVGQMNAHDQDLRTKIQPK